LDKMCKLFRHLLLDFFWFFRYRNNMWNLKLQENGFTLWSIGHMILANIGLIWKWVLLCQMSELGNVFVVLKLDEPVGGSLSSTEMGFVEQPHCG
jgi:hypothetical protein